MFKSDKIFHNIAVFLDAFIDEALRSKLSIAFFFFTFCTDSVYLYILRVVLFSSAI